MSTHWGNHIKNNIAGNKYESDFFHYKVVACFVTLFLMSSSLKLNWILYQISKISIFLLKVLKEQGQNNALHSKERNVYINRPDLNQIFLHDTEAHMHQAAHGNCSLTPKLPPGKLQCSSCRARSGAHEKSHFAMWFHMTAAGNNRSASAPPCGVT